MNPSHSADFGGSEKSFCFHEFMEIAAKWLVASILKDLIGMPVMC
jgi:hypothetical protein